MKNTEEFERLMAESKARIEGLILENKKIASMRFVKILDEMITVEESRGNQVIMSRREFDKIQRLSK